MTLKYPKIALQGINGLMFVREREILFAIADRNYTNVFLTANRKVKVLRKLKEVSELLPSENFIRIHRSHLINLEHVLSLDDAEAVVMSDGTCLGVARNRKADFIEKFTRI